LAFVDESIPASRNRLLAALPSDELARLWPRLEPVEFKDHETLHRQGDPIRAVYFLESGWSSLQSMLADGSSAEVGIVGREGMVGLTVLLGDHLAGVEARIQCPGAALTLTAGAFREELDRNPAFRSLLLRYALARYLQAVHLVACNARHHVDQRLARKLLMAHDRADGDEFSVTHESLSNMLGVRRAGVTVAAGHLQKAGLIRYSAGRLTISDRPGLEAAACECYGLVRDAFDRLLGPTVQPGTAHWR
jgi:CRP-like cAMP-binding protein